MKIKILSTVCGILMSASYSVAAQEKNMEKENSFLEALKQDAEHISKANGEIYENTFRRLKMQDAIIEKNIAIRLKEEFKDRITGLSIEDNNGVEVIVLLKGEEKVDDRILDIDGEKLQIKFIHGLPYSYVELTEAREKADRTALKEAVPNLMGSGTDQRTGEIVLIVLEDASINVDFMQKRVNEIFGVPVRIDFIKNPIQHNAVRGGGKLSMDCTTGFSVKEKNGTLRGITTAAHCGGSSAVYSDDIGASHLLQFVEKSHTSATDVQWFKSPYSGFFNPFFAEIKPQFYGSSSSMPTNLTGAITQAATVQGLDVCHKGKTTGYSCGLVAFTDFNPSEPPSSYTCGPSDAPISCAATWVAVVPKRHYDGTIPTLRCAGGDSGGPWVRTSKAVGIHVASSVNDAYSLCTIAVYMSIDHLDSLGVELLYH